MKAFIVNHTGKTYIVDPGCIPDPEKWFWNTYQVTPSTHMFRGSYKGHPFYAELTTYLQENCTYQIINREEYENRCNKYSDIRCIIS